MTAPVERNAPADRLAVMLSDLEGYIERRATELARVRIASAEHVAVEKVRAAQFEVQRVTDLNAELRRQNVALIATHNRLATKHGEGTIQ